MQLEDIVTHFVLTYIGKDYMTEAKPMTYGEILRASFDFSKVRGVTL